MFCASSRIINDLFNVRPRIKASGAASIVPRSNSLLVLAFVFETFLAVNAQKSTLHYTVNNVKEWISVERKGGYTNRASGRTITGQTEKAIIVKEKDRCL